MLPGITPTIGLSLYVPTGIEVTPTMSAPDVPAGYVASASSEFDALSLAWKAFDKSYADYNVGSWLAAAAAPGWLQIELPSRMFVASYKIAARSAAPTQAPKDWTLIGSNDGVTFFTVDTRTGQTGWSGGAGGERTYTLAVPAAYLIWRLNVSADDGGGRLAVTEFRLFG